MQDRGDIPPQALKRYIADVLSVYQNAASRRLIKTRNQLSERRLSDTRRTDKRQHLSGLAVKRHVPEHRNTVVI